MTRIRRIILADLPNETNPALPADAELLPLVNASTEADAEGWLWVPYADVPITAGEVRGIQRLNAAGAAELVNNFNSWRGRLQRLFRGLPFYVGHPDSKVFGAKHTDGRAYGWIKDLKAGAAALGVQVDWTAAGAELVNDRAYHWWSPFFKGRIAGKENGVTVYEPVLLQSAGFTNEPNWPGAALPNEQSDAGGEVPPAIEANQNEEVITVTLLERIKALLGMDGINNDDDALGAIGVMMTAIRRIKESVDARWSAEDAARAALPNTAGDMDVIEGYIALADARLAEMANALSAHHGETAQLATATTELATARERITALEADVAAERGARAAELVNQAVAAGRLLPADAETRKAALLAAPDFAAAAAELVNARPALKIAPKTRDLGERSTDQRGRQEKILELVNTRMAEKRESYDAAFHAVRSSQEHAALFINESTD